MGDFLQSASNAVAGNVSGPVDLIAAALRMMGVPVQEPVGGSAWMERQGLTKPVKQSATSVAGETAGLLLGPLGAAKAPEIAKGLLQHADQFQAYNKALGPAGVPLATVWHGSPHKFDKFDASKIGTGEGAQAYGHGLYLADAPDVAKTYARGQLSMKNIVEDNGKFFIEGPSKEIIAGPFDKKADAVIRLQSAGAKAANLYKVDLPDNAIARMLDWDAPLSKQGQKFVPTITKNTNGLRDEKWLLNVMGQTIDAFPTRKAAEQAAESATGMSLVKWINARGSRAGTDLMRQQGIPGIKYLDQMSRGAGQGTRNYVVFPGEEDILTILERNGVPIK